MKLLVVCVMAMAGWVAAAPGSLNSDKDTTEDLQQESEGDNLAPAINELERRKRGGSKSNLPYSKYRPSGGIHRYRYPLYRKRSYRPQPAYDYEDDVILPEAGESDYFDLNDQLRGPSLFRERSLLQQDRRKKMLLDNEGYLVDDFVPEKKVVPVPFALPLKKKDSVYSLANSPYDLHTIGRMYEMGKRDDTPYDLQGLNHFHSVGRKSPPRMMSSTEQFYDAIDSIKRKKAMFDERMVSPTEAEKLEQLLFLKNVLSSGNRYHAGQDMSFRDPMIRKKRDTSSVSQVTAKTNVTASHRRSSSKDSSRPQKNEKYIGDRRKRAFNDYFDWERKALESEYQPVEKRSSNNDLNDFLTREYFKSIARSVGQKKKRMAYAQFEADKRSSGLDELLENAAMLEYMQSKLREAEEEVVAEAEKDLGNGNTEELLSNIVVRLDALERMREALARLQELQTQEDTQSSGLSGAAKKRSSSSSRSPYSAGTAGYSAGTAGYSAVARKRSSVDNLKKNKKSAINARRISRMRREQDALPAIFLGNSREDCPVLDRVYMNCVDVTKFVGDQDEAFLGPCLRHEVCYMCGSSLSVSGHECDAILSSSLEAACSGNLDCLSAAGTTFNLLSNAERYDDDGSCTHDPCVRQFLESR